MMDWKDYYLKFADQATFGAVVPPALTAPVSPDHATDVLGTLYRDDTHEAVVGYHVNIRLRAEAELPTELMPYVLEVPAYLKHRFAE